MARDKHGGQLKTRWLWNWNTIGREVHGAALPLEGSQMCGNPSRFMDLQLLVASQKNLH